MLRRGKHFWELFLLTCQEPFDYHLKNSEYISKEHNYTSATYETITIRDFKFSKTMVSTHSTKNKTQWWNSPTIVERKFRYISLVRFRQGWDFIQTIPSQSTMRVLFTTLLITTHLMGYIHCYVYLSPTLFQCRLPWCSTCLSHTHFPRNWKDVIVGPLFVYVKRRIVFNHKPVSLTCLGDKLL